jgi:hypothetical protein
MDHDWGGSIDSPSIRGESEDAEITPPGKNGINFEAKSRLKGQNGRKTVALTLLINRCDFILSIIYDKQVSKSRKRDSKLIIIIEITMIWRNKKFKYHKKAILTIM